MSSSISLRFVLTSALVAASALASVGCGSSIKYIDFPVQEGNRQVMARKFYNDGLRGADSQDPTERAYQAAKSGDLKEAIKLAHEAVQANPKDEYAHYDLGVLLEANHQWAEARAEMEAAKAIDPKDSSYQQEIAFIDAHK